MYTFGMHQAIFAALASGATEQNCYQKSKNFENITSYLFAEICWNSVTKNPKMLSESRKMWAEEKGNSDTFH